MRTMGEAMTSSNSNLDSDWMVVIKQHSRARPTGILSSYAKRTLSEYSRENTALKKVLKGRFFFLAVV
jgi:hypothetical protein